MGQSSCAAPRRRHRHLPHDSADVTRRCSWTSPWPFSRKAVDAIDAIDAAGTSPRLRSAPVPRASPILTNSRGHVATGLRAWVAEARGWGESAGTRPTWTKFSMILTTWARIRGIDLADYANREWNGLLGRYYAPWWKLFRLRRHYHRRRQTLRSKSLRQETRRTRRSPGYPHERHARQLKGDIGSPYPEKLREIRPAPETNATPEHHKPDTLTRATALTVIHSSIFSQSAIRDSPASSVVWPGLQATGSSRSSAGSPGTPGQGWILDAGCAGCGVRCNRRQPAPGRRHPSSPIHAGYRGHREKSPCPPLWISRTTATGTAWRKYSVTTKPSAAWPRATSPVAVRHASSPSSRRKPIPRPPPAWPDFTPRQPRPE